jgi:hypothetical protein
MHAKAKASPKPESGPDAPRLGPILQALLQSVKPLGASLEHFSAARPELLKGMREVVEARITQSPPVGPIMTAVLDRFGMLGASHGHFNAARLEILKGLRTVLDERLAQLSNSGAKAKSEKIHVL